MTPRKTRSFSQFAKINRIGFPALVLAICAGSCGRESSSPATAQVNETPAATTQSGTTTSAELWTGNAAGYVSHGDPAKDDTAFLIDLGHVLAAIGRANHHDKEPGMSNPFTADVLEAYAAIDPVVSGKSRSNLSLQPLLAEIAAPETFAMIMDNNSENRMARNAITTKLGTLIGRIDSIITERFPSTKASALAMSALHREAGDLLKQGLSVDGQILNLAQYRDAVQLVEASLRLQVKKVSSCQLSRDAMSQIGNRGPLVDLLDRLIIVTESGTVSANAGDVFEAALSLEKLGSGLPDEDEQICKA